MQKINTIFWDLDGTLINTDNLYDCAIEFACNELSCSIIKRIDDLPNGKTLLFDFSFLTGLSIINDIEKLNQLKELAIKYFKDNFTRDLIIKNSLELFNYFYTTGLKQSIISNSNQELCEFTTNIIGIKGKYFRCYGIESVKFGKPYPDLYIKALKEHDVNVSECLAFEDSQTGIDAAKSANLTVVGVGNTAYSDYNWNIDNEPIQTILKKLSENYEFARIL